MENVITALIVVAVLVLVIFGISQSSLATQAAISESSRIMQERVGERARTGLTPNGAATSVLGDYVQVTLQNTGTTKLSDLDQWDVILQYTDVFSGLQVKWYAYETYWTAQMYQSISPLTAEVIEPGILNPGEYIILQINTSPAVGTGTTNLATIATPNGIKATSVFTH